MDEHKEYICSDCKHEFDKPLYYYVYGEFHKTCPKCESDDFMPYETYLENERLNQQMDESKDEEVERMIRESQ